ncbi:MAG: DUF1292 domain-containing protein [Clostridiales bacterium]|nr:DUF1292 domain-containing protein [Clostridiales bacterium]
MTDNKDIVEFVADNGDVIQFEVVDYFLFDGEEYVILADLGNGSEEVNDEDKVDVFIMKVVVIDDDNEEFVMIPPEVEDKVLDFAGKLLKGELPNEDEIL